MDPNKCLEQILEDVGLALDRAGPVDDRDGPLVLLAERVRALDEWLAKGGFPPSRWRPRK